MEEIPASHPLRRLFAGLTEQTFVGELGVADVRLVDYLTELLTRFLHRDGIYSVRNLAGQPLEKLAEMWFAAEKPGNVGNPRREVFRHMGDFALFWTGVYPESLQTRTHRKSADAILDYCETGKRSYYLASTYADTPHQAEEAPVLRRLSHDFDTCRRGLRLVRDHWEHGQA